MLARLSALLLALLLLVLSTTRGVVVFCSGGTGHQAIELAHHDDDDAAAAGHGGTCCAGDHAAAPEQVVSCSADECSDSALLGPVVSAAGPICDLLPAVLPAPDLLLLFELRHDRSTSHGPPLPARGPPPDRLRQHRTIVLLL